METYQHYNLEKPLIKSLSVKNFSNLIWCCCCLLGNSHIFFQTRNFLNNPVQKGFLLVQTLSKYTRSEAQKLAAAKLLLKNSRNFFCMKRISYSQNSKIPYAPKGVSLGLWEWEGIRVIQSTNTTQSTQSRAGRTELFCVPSLKNHNFMALPSMHSGCAVG